MAIKSILKKNEYWLFSKNNIVTKIENKKISFNDVGNIKYYNDKKIHEENYNLDINVHENFQKERKILNSDFSEFLLRRIHAKYTYF